MGRQTERDRDFREMLIPPRTWTRIGDPVNLCVRRNLTYSKRPFLWMLLILLLLCFLLQTFVTSSDRSNRNLGPAPKSVWGYIQSSENQDTRPKQTGGADPTHQSKGHRKPPDESLLNDIDKMWNLSGSSQMERRRATPGELPEPSSPDLYSTRNPLTTERRLVHATPPTVHATATCHPQSHLVFLKTHKTASSTILNILYRYGESRNLTFALPANKHSQLFYPSFFASQFVEGVSSRTVREFHIMCNHMRFRKAEVAKVMPEDTFYFSILRHPVTMMESVFIYYKSIQAFHKTRSLDDFLDNSQKYNASVSNNHYAHNVLAFDFGFDNNVTADAEDLEAKANRAIAAIERDFHLILISEYFDESMILLKHALCWSLEDVASFKLNTRSNKTRHQISLNTTEKIKRWNALDWRIYLHFNATFWHKVDSRVGQKQMKKELSQLRDLQVKLANTCLKEGGPVDPAQVKDTQLKPFQYGAAVIQGYNLNQDLDPQTRTQCQRLITPELQYTEHLYSQQFPAKHKQVKRKVPPQHQRSGRTSVMGVILAAGAHHRQVIRHKFSNAKNQNATSALSTIANNKPSLL